MAVASSSSSPADDSTSTVRHATRCVGTSRHDPRHSACGAAVTAELGSAATRSSSVSVQQAPGAASSAERGWSGGRPCTPTGRACRCREAQLQKVPGCDHEADDVAGVANAAAVGESRGCGTTP